MALRIVAAARCSPRTNFDSGSIEERWDGAEVQREQDVRRAGAYAVVLCAFMVANASVIVRARLGKVLMCVFHDNVVQVETEFIAMS
ncbi:MAG: hypothetical protein OEQ18_09685 [Gammaproteobacteria bacterium]|nr:hypothetical protein [Gammaproteobacteria bacterium]